MASSTTLNAKNLEALGAARLAALLIEVSDGHDAVKRRLRLELAATAGPAEVAKQVRKRLTTIGRSRSFVDWNKTRTLADDLDAQRRAIVDQIAPMAPADALDLLWRFLQIAPSVLNRCDDSNGTIGRVFEAACSDLGPVATAAKGDPIALADRVFSVLQEPEYGLTDALIPSLAPALGDAGLVHLADRVDAWGKTVPPRPADKDRVVVGFGPTGPLYEDEIQAGMRTRIAHFVLRQIAEARGDVDALIAQYDPDTRKTPRIAAQLAHRLLEAGRAAEALDLLDAAEHPRQPATLVEVADARIAVLEALQRPADAQGERWTCFAQTLSVDHLRAYLKRLPDFDDMEAEEAALAHVREAGTPLASLHFFLCWPALDRAAAVILERADDLDGDAYMVLTPAADALAEKHPLAATVALRAMIDFTLQQARSSRYKHSARHLASCADLATHIPDVGSIEPHDAYVARLRKQHGRKAGFWSLTKV